jgi:hypothetical protein
MAENNTPLDDDETVDALAHARALLGEDSDPEPVEATTSVEEEAAAEAAPPLPGMEEVPNVPPTLDPEPPRRKPKRKAPNKKNPFSQMVGAGERLLVHKRDNLNGQLTYIGQYAPEDLMRSGNVDVFLQEYVVPTWKDGEFQLTLMGVDGSQKPLGSRKIGAPPGSEGSSNQENSIKELFELQQAMDAKAKKESEDDMKNLVAMMGLMKQMQPQQKESGGDSMMPMMMMMMMMMNQQKSSGPDPMMQMLLTKALEKDEEVPPPAFPMPPMMPAAASPTEDMASLATLIQALKPAQTSTPVQDLAAIAQMFHKPDDDKLTIKDLISLAPTIKDIVGGNQAPANSFADTVQNLGQLQQLLQGMSGGGETSFTDLIQSAIEAAPGMAEALKRGKGAPAAAASDTTQAPTTKAAARKVPAIPAGFKEFSDKLNEAADAGEDDDIGDEEQLIEQCLRGLIWLRKEDKQWLPYVDGFLTFVKDDNKEKCMRLLEVFLRTFMDRDFITDGTANSTYQSFDDNWNKVRVALGFAKADEEAPPKEEGGVEVTGTETVAEAGRDDTESPEVIDDSNDDEVEMSDEEIAALAAEVDDEEEEEEAADEEVVANGGDEGGSVDEDGGAEVIDIDASNAAETVVPPGEDPPQPSV